MTLLTASFENSPSGTTIPLTGGADNFQGGTTGSGTSFVSDNTVAAAIASGSFAAKVSVGGTARDVYRGWAWTGGVIHVRQYIYLTANPSARFTFWANLSNAGNDISRIRINTDGTLGVGTPATVWLTTATIPLNTLCRIEASFDHAAGTASLDLYSGNSTTPITGGSVTATGVAFATTNIVHVACGISSTLTNYTFWTDGWAASDVARVGPIVTGGTVTGVAAPTVIASADGGTVNAVVGATVTIAGVTAQVVVQGGERPLPPDPPSTDAVWPPDPYRAVIRSGGGHALAYIVDASLNGIPIAGATGLRPTSGTITDTTKPGVRRVANVQLPPTPGLFDKLSPIGTTLTITARITYLNRSTLDIPMGVFDVDTETLSEGGGGLSLTAPDKWARIQRARFPLPQASMWGSLVVDQIAELIRGALGPSETVAVSATSRAQMGPLTWEKDRDKAIIELANGIGAWVYFDRNGLATIADLPTVGASADWLIDASPTGVLVELDRKRSRENTRNLVIVESSSTDAPFNTQPVWDNDPGSPTYAGPDPINQPELAGPFGVVPYFFDTPLPLTDAAANVTGQTILARVAGLASQVSLTQVPNPALDAFDVIDVLPPKERYDIARVIERHVADTVTHPLGVGAQQIEGRSTRTDDFS